MNDKRTMHTPGPWRVGSPYGLVKTEVVAPDSSRAVCTVWTQMSVADRETGRQVASDDPEGHANARLIAAAPELLGELKRMYEHFSAFAADHSTEASTETWAALHCAKAAIAAAEVQS